MKILSIDLGKNFGWCYLDDTTYESGYGKYTDLVDWGKQFSKLVELWKPEIVVLSQTNNFGFWNASRAALMQAGVAFFICGYKDIPGVEFNDSSARKAVFGKAIKKIEVQKKYKSFKMQSDQLDAYILARGWQTLNKV
jgi:hypothetical protein